MDTSFNSASRQPERHQSVVSKIPYLRRYARAFLGDQARADQIVKGALNDYLNERSQGLHDPNDGQQIRLELFRALIKAIASGSPSDEDNASLIANQGIVDRHIRHLEILPRQALLLAVLEGFERSEIAWILDSPVADVDAWLARAQELLQQQPPSRVLIIEDEPIVALDLVGAVQARGHKVVGIARTHEEAVRLANSEHPELILADIQLADDSSGLEAVGDILQLGKIPVVFVTACPERLLTSKRPEPAFLISKPYNDRLLAVTMSQALARRIHH